MPSSVSVAAGSAGRRSWLGNPTPWLLCSPALLLFVGLLLVPLLLTLVLSFSVYNSATGTGEGYTLAHYIEVLTDSYYHEIFLRTGGMSLVVTLLCVDPGRTGSLDLVAHAKPMAGDLPGCDFGPLADFRDRAYVGLGDPDGQ